MKRNLKSTNGIFVSLDGPNGVGKSTLIDAVKSLLVHNGLSVHLTKEVSATPLGKFIQETHKVYRGKTLAYLLAADRQNHIESDIFPALQTHDVVLTDRYVGSSLVYQRLDAVELSFLWEINKDFLKPDLSIVVLASQDVIGQRMALRTSLDRFEQTFSCAQEIHLFVEAASFMKKMERRVFQFDNGKLSVEDGAKVLTDQILLVRQTLLQSEAR